MSSEHEDRFERIESILERLAAGEEKHRADIAALTANVDRQSADIVALTANADKQRGDITSMFTVIHRFEESHKQLLTAQILIGDRMDKMDKRREESDALLTRVERTLDRVAVNLEAITIKHAETDDKLNALIHVVDEWISERGKRNGNGGEPKPGA